MLQKILASIVFVLIPVLSPFASCRVASAQIENVILLVGDGVGYNTWDIGSMYQGRWDAKAGYSTQVFDGDDWVQLACSTHPLTMSKMPTGSGTQDPALIYDPAQAWDKVNGYLWLKSTYTDSAASGTALATGNKTYNAAINWSDLGRPIPSTMPEIAEQHGKSVGIVTSVQWSHATPACLAGARADKRSKYAEIAEQIVRSTSLDVIMGAGNPDYDQNGQPVGRNKDYRYVGGQAIWEAIERARSTPNGTYNGFRPVSTKSEFEALVNGPTPTKVIGTAQVAKTLQQRRSGADHADIPYDDPFIETVPSLATMTLGALNVLDENPQGMWLMVEGGAVDWSGHDNMHSRLIEEQIEFVKMIEAVVRWVETNSSWDKTLLILTADHETGLIWGPNSNTIPFNPVRDNGQGNMPSFHFNSGNHSNQLVPLYARGEGSQWFAELVRGNDPVRGDYIDNVDIFSVMNRALTRQAAVEVAEP